MQSKIIILSNKRQEAITKVLTAVRTYIQTKKVKLFEISLGKLSKNEFVYAVTTSFNNYQPKQVASDLNSQLESMSVKNMDFDLNLDDNENDMSVVEVELSQQKCRILKQNCIQMALQIEFGLFRCSNQQIFRDNRIVLPKDDESVEAIQQFIKRLTAHQNVKAQYEFMGRYGYFIGKNESLTFLPDVNEKIQNPRMRKYREKMFDGSNQYNIIASDVIARNSNNELVCLAGVEEVPRLRQLKSKAKITRRVRMIGEISTILRHFRTYARKTIAKARKQLRQTTHIDINIDNDYENRYHIVQFQFEEQSRVYDLVKQLKSAIDYTTIRFDPSEIRFNLKERQQLLYLESQFCCSIKTVSQRVAECMIITRFQKPFLEFLKKYNGLHHFTYQFINKAQCQYWQTFLKDKIDKMSKIQDFSYTFQQQILKITCSSIEAQKAIMQSLMKLKDNIVVSRLLSGKAAANDFVSFLECRKQPSIQLKMLDIGQHTEMKPSKNIMNMGCVNVHFNLVNYISAKQSKFIDLSKCIAAKDTLFQLNKAKDQNLNSLKKRIYSTFCQGHSFINIVVTEQHYKQAYLLCKGIKDMASGKVTPKNRKFDVNYFTECPESLRIFMWNMIEKGEDSVQDKTILVKGLKEEVDRLVRLQSSEYSPSIVKVDIRGEQIKDKMEAMLPQLNIVVSDKPKLSINGERMFVQSHDKREVSQMLSKMILYVSGRQQVMIK